MAQDKRGLVGDVLDDRFAVRSVLGKGGMGVVYRAHQLSMDRDVALKVLRPEVSGDEQAIRRFFLEARAASRLTNPHTITVFDFGQAKDGLLYIAMELLEGRTLFSEVTHNGPMGSVRAAWIVDQILDSLVEAHAEGIVHRDMKPDNVFLLQGRGSDDFVKVLDFGIAQVPCAEGARVTRTGLAVGTPTYMSPEQTRAEPLDGRSDLYSLGVILFEMLAGKPPFSAESPVVVAMMKAQEKPPLISQFNPDADVSPALQDLVMRLLSADRSERPRDAATTKRLLRDAMAGGNAGADVPAVPRLEAVVPAAGGEEIPGEPGPVDGDGTSSPAFEAVFAPRRSARRWVAMGVGLLLATGVVAWLAGGGPGLVAEPRLAEQESASSGAEAAGSREDARGVDADSVAAQVRSTDALDLVPSPPPPERAVVAETKVPAGVTAAPPKPPLAKPRRSAVRGMRSDDEILRILKPGAARPSGEARGTSR